MNRAFDRLNCRPKHEVIGLGPITAILAQLVYAGVGPNGCSLDPKDIGDLLAHQRQVKITRRNYIGARQGGRRTQHTQQHTQNYK